MLSADEEDIYNETILVSLELYKATNNEKYLAEAFTFTEKSKSSVLLSHMREVEARQIGRIPDSLRQKEQNIKANIASYNKLIHEEEQKENPNNDRINLWKSRLFDYNQQYEKLITRFENNFEEYYRLKYKTEVLQVNEIRQMLDTNQALVEYNLADTLLFTFVITPTEYHVERTSIDTTFFNNISEVRQALMVSRMDHFDQQNYNNYVFAAHDLYNKLIKPVKDKIEHKKLLLIPHNELGFISFDVLLQQEADTTRMEYRGLDYLVNDYTLSYASNATLYFHELERDSKATKDILAFAPSYDAKNPIKAKEIMRQTDDIEYLLPIPGVFEEVNFIKKNFKADVFKGKKATEKNFKKRAQKYSVLHLAMHTLINNEEPMFSKLVFYQDDNTRNNDEDPALNTYELFNMELNADMAVLSACNTGVGKLRKGEGIMSLARGFLYARVPSIIMTLWPAQDQSSADLMAQFYKYLAQGYAKDEALRKAKVNFIENADQLRGHPHYWAGYVAIGDTSNINIPDKTPLWSFYAGGGIIVVLMASLLFFLIRRKKMKA
ncbi:MAG: CHAT domain-containing protein [Bacteroidales bacterium]|nr:CHAT domain-containing protein [Bacteroidales bacterium]